MEELKKQAHKEFEKILDEIIADEENSECNVGYYKESYLNRLDSLIDKTVQMERERIVALIEKLKNNVQHTHMGGCFDCSKDLILDDIISLITNKSDINK